MWPMPYAFLVSDEASFISNALLSIYGGLVMGTRHSHRSLVNYFASKGVPSTYIV